MSDRLGGGREGRARGGEEMGGEGRAKGGDGKGGEGREERRWVRRKGEGGEETMLEWTQACTQGTHEQ